jgi:hypothetical protein
VPATNQMKTLPLWVENIACHEAERIYEMMPRIFGERAQVIARLEAGIVLSRRRRRPRLSIIPTFLRFTILLPSKAQPIWCPS